MLTGSKENARHRSAHHESSLFPKRERGALRKKLKEREKKAGEKSPPAANAGSSGLQLSMYFLIWKAKAGKKLGEGRIKKKSGWEGDSASHDTRRRVVLSRCVYRLKLNRLRHQVERVLKKGEIT